MRRLIPLYIIIFLAFVGFSITIPTFTTMMVHPKAAALQGYTFGMRTFLLGALIATYPTGQFFGGSIIGAFSDQFGRKRVLIISLLLAALCYFGVAFALHIINLPILFISLFVGGFFEANIVIAQNAIADVVPKEERTEKFGYIYAAISLGYVVGPIIGGFLSNPKFVPWFSYSTPFILVALLLIGAALWLYFQFKETYKPTRSGPLLNIQSLTNLKNIFADKRLRFFYGINAILYFIMFGYFRSYPIYISKTFSLGITDLSLFVAYVGVPIILTNLFFIKPLSKKFSAYILTKYTSLLMGISMIVIPFFPFVSSLWITLFIATLFVAICLPSCSSAISHEAHSDEQGKVMGNNLSIQGGMTALSAVTGGLLAAPLVALPLYVFGTLGLFTASILIHHKRRMGP